MPTVEVLRTVPCTILWSGITTWPSTINGEITVASKAVPAGVKLEIWLPRRTWKVIARLRSSAHSQPHTKRVNNARRYFNGRVTVPATLRTEWCSSQKCTTHSLDWFKRLPECYAQGPADSLTREARHSVAKSRQSQRSMPDCGMERAFCSYARSFLLIFRLNRVAVRTISRKVDGQGRPVLTENELD